MGRWIMLNRRTALKILKEIGQTAGIASLKKRGRKLVSGLTGKIKDVQDNVARLKDLEKYGKKKMTRRDLFKAGFRELGNAAEDNLPKVIKNVRRS